MAKPRTKPFKPGDKFVVYIPNGAPATLINWLNEQKYVSPKVIELLKQNVSDEAQGRV